MKKLKRPRSKDGVVYSDIGQYRKNLIRVYAKNKEKLQNLHGGDMFRDFGIYENIHKGQAGATTGLMFAEFICFGGLLFSDYCSYYIKNNYLLDFLKTSSLKASDTKSLFLSMSNNIGEGTRGIMINLPKEKDSIFLVFQGMNIKERGYVYLITAIRGDNIYHVSINQDDSDWLLNYGGAYEEISNDWAITLNFLMYIDCFPECIVDGVPDIDCRADSAKEKKTITLQPDIEEICLRAQITPHMRRGHFRFLQSDKFVNAKGKTVYVKPSMVKGRAKTLLEYGEEVEI